MSDDVLAALKTEAATFELLAGLARAEVEMRERLAAKWDVEYVAIRARDLRTALGVIEAGHPNRAWLEVLSSEPGLHRFNVYTAKAP